ncbi:hypothetical protein ACRYCC_13245 [Actinomadura scrupuli]|uniref:hypothetical protein n=1 Tax=Actinomadura scrupuli TaxID=559629 RepID=UPI003D95CE3A
MSSDNGDSIRYLVVGRHPLDPAIPVLSPLSLKSGETEFVTGWLHEHRDDLRSGSNVHRLGSLPWHKVDALISALGLEDASVTGDLIREITSGIDLAYAGITCGAGRDHWAIEGDVRWALGSDPGFTVVSGASLSTKIDMLAHTSTRSFPLAELASEQMLAQLAERGERVISVTYAEQGLSLDELETVQRLASTIAKLILGRPEWVRGNTRIRLDIPCEQHWLAVLDAAQQGLISSEVCLAWFDRVKAHSLLLEQHFTTLLERMLGSHFHQVLSYHELHLAGRYLYGAFRQGSVPQLENVLLALSRGSRLWRWALHSGVQRDVGPEFGGSIDTVSRLIDMAGMVTLMSTAADGAVIAVDAPEPTARTMAFVKAYGLHINARDPELLFRVVAVYPLPKIFGNLRADPASYHPGGGPGAGDGTRQVLRNNGGGLWSFDFMLAATYPV